MMSPIPALPGYPASHGCIRLLERDAAWVFNWGDAGTPLWVLGGYAFASPPPWRSLEFLARGIQLPPSPTTAPGGASR